ncbi:Smr domain containing protein [Brugia malayi]|uniref:Bm3601 n=1 Tax=Brugia malayi TaxID=6279 RepID=A0A0H5S9Z2_BRUMA|nr:Smr domain containing protein [Brugia malayi]CRZ25401.1 Bm3601 [Brugia malayi]VIO90575.1 Smr domain containing protein [Brugia malayi]
MVTPSIHEQCWEPTTNLEHIRKCIQNGHHIMVIMRGIPGSGKSYLASDLISGTNGAVFNTDKYFVQNGVYQFDPTKLDEYHQKNWKEAKDAIQQGIKPIIIDNTNIFVTHMKPYINLAVKNLYEIYFVEPETEWKKNAKECARRNAHSVPEEKIAYMAECFEKVSLSDVIKPTQLRTVPPLVDINDEDDTYNLLLSKLDSLPDSLLGKDATDNKKSSEQLISLIPHQIPKNLRTFGCQTSDLIRVLDLSNPSSSVNDEFVCETVCDAPDFSYKKKMKVKATQAGDGNILSDIELLIAFFPDEKPSDLSHILEIAGLKNAMTLLKEMNAHMDICTPVGKNKNIDAESLSQTYYWWDKSECEQVDNNIDNNSSPAFVPNFELNRPISEELAPCTYMQCCDPEPVPSGYCRMQISVDMMEQLTQLFGDAESNTFLKTYVDLPIYLWRQIYFHWQGISTTTTEVDNAFGSENFDFSALVSSDEELARILQGHELASDEFLENGKHMSIAERLQLSALMKDYSGVDRERIAECFRDNKFSAEATRNTLDLFVNGSENIQTVPANPSRIEYRPNQSGNCSVPAASSYEESSVLKPDLELAHKEAFELREQAEWYDKQKHELLLRANNHRDFGAKMHYFAEAQKLGKKAKDCVAELNERLIKANTSTLFIDLHYMNVQSALKLLKAKLNAADRPPEFRRGRSRKKLVVLTGYGKLSDGQAKIKPAVIQWLEQCGYEYYNTSNKGELIVECK